MRFFLLGLIVLGMLSCDREREATSLNNTKKVEETTTANQVAEQEKGPRFVVPERIHGLPVPSDVVSLVEFPEYTLLITEWNLDQVERFFQKELVDFEIVRDEEFVRIIGLRSYMASARASHTGKRKKRGVAIRYYPAKQEKQAELKPTPKPKKGEPVELTTKNGDPLAPGAKWFEPYTPPPGSPLDKPRYKGNFGTPFGKWSNN